MIKDITLGQYYPVESIIHKMDARFKIIATLLYIFCLFIAQSLWTYLPLLLFICMVITLSGVPLRYVMRGLKPIMFIIAFTVLVNMLFTPGDVMLSVWRLQITYQGVTLATFLGLRLILLIIGSSMMTFTTSPLQLTDGLEMLMTPFKKIGFPAHEIAMMMSIAMRFIPTLIEETDKIMKAQMARGTGFDSGSLITRAKNLVPIMVPLFISAFRRADELAMAMEARCYNGGKGRTRMKQMKFSRYDLYGLLGIVILVIAVLAINYAL